MIPSKKYFNENLDKKLNINDDEEIIIENNTTSMYILDWK